MGMVVQHNISALNAYNKLNANVSGLEKSSEKLSSGYRINRAGDDAAGLAISEKMRSQIRGLTQATRNAQDGISMIQTFEGAAQETHTILQRMKELATESANGTYDNATDRAAIQLEYDQLNDELNQIADTDYNGVVILNGGVMADGTRAVDGNFNYTAGVNDASIAAAATDISGDQAHTIVDQTSYDKTAADAVWDALGLDVDKNDTANVTFMFDGTDWRATAVTDENGEVISGAKTTGITATASDINGNAGNGGFTVSAGGLDVTNAIFDAVTAKEGDTVTVQFTNTKETTYAPNNIGIDEDTYEVEADDPDTSTLTTSAVKGLSVELDASVTDAAMNETLQGALDDLDEAEFTATYAAGVATITADGFAIADDGTITHDASGLVLGKVTAADITADTPATEAKAATLTTSNAALTLGAIDDVTLTADATFTYDAINGWSDGVNNYATAAALEAATGIDVAGTANAGDTITFTAATDATDASSGPDANANGTIKFGVNVDAYNVADFDSVTVHAVATPEVATMAASVAAGGVSTSNAYGNSTAIMTYSDNITLQVGARTKDAVNFSFSYNVDDTADMGDLRANLDISSRANGLNTANLSLATQDDANYAIDQIDKAINKVSMVRATFGSIQNRLEYKIENLTTTNENLTEAESTIRDTDMASEMLNYTKYSILQQAAQSMLAQANQQPQSILQLLG